jgi:hypothetical protein
VSFERVSLCVAKLEGDWLLETEITLRCGSAAEGDLLIDLQLVPLELLHLTCDRGTPIMPDITGAVPLQIAVRLNEVRTGNWNGARLRCAFRWSPDRALTSDVGAAGRSFAVAPCLLLPDMLPRATVAGEGVATTPPALLARIAFNGELPVGLSAGGVAIPNRSGDPTTELLQTIVVPSITRRAAVIREELIVMSDDSRDAVRDNLSLAAGYVSPLLDFLKRELGLGRSVRPVVYVGGVTYPPSFYPVGAYVPVAAEDVGAVVVNVGKPMSIIRLLAQAWLNAGIRIYGENASDLSLAIGGAIGLYWLEATRHSAELERALASQSASVAAARSTGAWRPADHVLAIQLSLYDSLSRPAVGKRIRALLAEHWGRYVPQEVLIKSLRDLGVAVPSVFM